MSINVKNISIVIPVKNNQNGIDVFLAQLFATHKQECLPAEVIVVDNNSSTPIKIRDHFDRHGVDIRLLTCSKPGPAAARNHGADSASGEWLLFVDSDCVPTDAFISGYLSALKGQSSTQSRSHKNSPIGYQGAVGALGNDVISNYYVSQQIHRPPEMPDAQGGSTPKCLVSANIMILKRGFEQISGFNDAFIFGGEDIDFSLRLAKLGPLEYAPKALVLHCYGDGLRGFIRRFFAYGKGNRCVIEYHEVSLFPLPFTAKNKSVIGNHVLAVVQWACLLAGYLVQDLEFRVARQRR